MTHAMLRSGIFTDPGQTQAFARKLAPLLVPGDVLLLHGPIGAGKTLFARALIQARLAPAGRVEDIPSPTYTLVQTYDDGASEIWHADLYRLGGPGEVDELGLSDAFDTAICLVEWPDRLAGLVPTGALNLTLELGRGEGERRYELTSDAPRWGPLVEKAVGA